MACAATGGGAALPGLERLRDRAEAFTVELARARYEALAGLRDAPGLEEVYGRYPELFEAAAVEEVRTALASAPAGSEVARRLAFLEEFLASGLEEDAGKAAEERYLRAEGDAVLEVQGESFPFRAARVRLRNSADRARRRAIAEAMAHVDASLQPHLREQIERAHAAAAGLGAPDYVAHRARLGGFDPDALLRSAARILEETEAAYLDLFDWFARRELGLRRADVAHYDLPFLLRGQRFDAAFERSDLLPNVRRMLADVRLDPTAGGNVEYDLEPRPRKSARAFCSAIRVPQEVKLVILPSGGADDYAAFLHELGHSLHYGYVDPRAPFEFRVLGDNSITETYAAAFDRCLLLPGWLRDVQGMDETREFLLLQWFGELFLLRRYAAKLRYELALHVHGPRPEIAERYVEELARATGVAPARERYLEDVDPRFYCVAYLQSWALCALLHGALRERFDSDWYRNPRTGPWLRGLFARGQRDRPDELAALLGAATLDVGPLLDWAREGLEGSRSA
ncbi:MAG: hypothetical protein ABR599_01730 [Gemmatimonadota bacterium]